MKEFIGKEKKEMKYKQRNKIWFNIEEMEKYK